MNIKVKKYSCKRPVNVIEYASTIKAGVLELADEVDSKSIGGNTVRVRPPPPAPI